MTSRRLPFRSEALEGHCEVLEAKVLAHEPYLEVIGVHPDIGGPIGDVTHGHDGVLGHGYLLSVGQLVLARTVATRRPAVLP